MPKALHDALERGAKKKGFTGKRKDRYVYGGMANILRNHKRPRARPAS